MEKAQGKIRKNHKKKAQGKNLAERITRKSHGKRLEESHKEKLKESQKKMSQGKITMKELQENDGKVTRK